MTAVRIFAAAAALCLFGSVAAAIPASAAAHGATVHRAKASSAAATYFEINNYQTNGCIGIAAGQPYAGDWSCTGNPDQTWHWGAVISGSGSLTFRQLINGDNKCLGIAGGSTQLNAKVTAWSCAGEPLNQGWQTASGTGVGGYVWLDNFDGLAVGIAGASSADGASLVQYTPEFDTNNQFWSFKAPA